MLWLRLFVILIALLGAVAVVVAILPVDLNQPPREQYNPSPEFGAQTDPPKEPVELVDPFPEVDLSAESLDEVRRAELRRRARRPDGDPKRKYALNYEGVLKGPTPKPAEAMPATACRSVEPTPKRTDNHSGPHRVHDTTVALFETESGFGFWRMLFATNKRGVRVSMGAEDVDRVELVSLLTAAEPSAYVLDQMATPPLARQAKRRPLDEFEQRGLEAVRRGEELVWTREAPKRMFGAIRAKADCLDCHSKAKEGDLLGAFTYYLDVPVDQINR